MASAMDSRHLIDDSRSEESDDGGEDSAASILQSVREQEHQFAQLTREIEEEKRAVARQLNQDSYASQDELYYNNHPDAYVSSRHEEYDDPHEETSVLIGDDGIKRTVTKHTVTKTVTEQRVRHIEQPNGYHDYPHNNINNSNINTEEPTYATVQKTRPRSSQFESGDENAALIDNRASSASDGSDGYRRPYPEERKQTPEKFQAEDYGLDDDRGSDYDDDVNQYDLDAPTSYQRPLQTGSISSESEQRYDDDDTMDVPVAAPRSTQGRAPLATQELGSRASLDRLGANAWHNPTLEEVVKMLSYNMLQVQQNAAAYIQHLCFNNDKMKADVRKLGGIPPLVRLLDHPNPEVQFNACGALRNLCYGPKNDQNKIEIKNCEGVPVIVRLVRAAKTTGIKEQATGTLWNLSAHPELKGQVLELGMEPLTNQIIIPYAEAVSKHGGKAKDIEMLDVFTNTVGVIRNLSSTESAESRRRLRNESQLVYSLKSVIQTNIENENVRNKDTENCICVLRNLTYKLQEETPNAADLYMLDAPVVEEKQSTGCFGKKAKEKPVDIVEEVPPSDPDAMGAALLWQPDISKMYVKLLDEGLKQEGLTEAALGAILNLTHGTWKWALYSRIIVRKEKGLPVVIDRLRTDKDQVVRAGTIALSNLAEDNKNKELIGKFAMKDLVYKLPGGSDPNIRHSDTTSIAVLNTIRVLVDKNSDNVRHLMEAAGIERVTTINNSRENSRPFHARVVKAAGQVLKAIWANKDVHSSLKKDGWNKNHFQPTITSDTLPRNKTLNAHHSSPNNASVGGRRARKSVDEVELQGQHTENGRKPAADSWV